MLNTADLKTVPVHVRYEFMNLNFIHPSRRCLQMTNENSIGQSIQLDLMLRAKNHAPELFPFQSTEAASTSTKSQETATLWL